MPVVVSDLDRMGSPNGLSPHHLGDRRCAPTAQPIHGRSDQEVRSDIVGRVERLEDVASAIADMDAPIWVAELPGGPRHVLQQH